MGKIGQELLWEFLNQWDKHTILTYYLKKVFTYLDKFYLQDARLPTLSQTGLNIFKEKVFTNVYKVIVRTIFELIEAEREGEVVDWTKLKKILYCYRTMGLTNASVEKDELTNERMWQGVQNLQYYKEVFEGEFVTQTTEFYKKQADQWILTVSCPEYVNSALAAIKKEEDKVLNFLDKETRPKLLSSLEEVLVERHAQALTEKDKTGVVDMFKDKRQDELKKLYILLSKRPNTLHFIYEKMKPYIELRGKAVVEDKEVLKDPIIFATKLMELKREIDSMVQTAFKNDASFMQTRDRAFQNFMNECNFTPGFLAEYVDMLMKTGLKGKAAETEDIIGELFELFKLIKQKDAFTNRHQQLYSLRLLQNTSISQDAEELLISKLKIELGAQYVNKFVQMNVDMKNSRELMEGFRKQSHKGNVKGIDMEVKVLTAGLWGEQKNARCKLPQEVNNCGRFYEEYFKSNHVGKNLSWVAALGDCEIKSLYLPKPYTFLVSVYQCTILSLYNVKTEYTYSEIKEATGLTDEDIAAHLLVLMNPKMGKLLLKENQKVPKCTPDEKIAINPAFSSASLRITFAPSLHQPKVKS